MNAGTAGLVQEQTRQMSSDSEGHGADEQECGDQQYWKWKWRNWKELFESFVDHSADQTLGIGRISRFANIPFDRSAGHRP